MSTSQFKAPEQHLIICHLSELLTAREMTLTELSKRVGISLVNLSLLKNGGEQEPQGHRPPQRQFHS